jgi:hypothetical protein
LDTQPSCRAIPAADPELDFAPELMHQLFENERIFGYAGLVVALWFSRRSQRAFLRVWHTGLVPGLDADDVRGVLLARLVPALAPAAGPEDAAAKHAEEDAAKAAPPPVAAPFTAGKAEIEALGVTEDLEVFRRWVEEDDAGWQRPGCACATAAVAAFAAAESAAAAGVKRKRESEDNSSDNNNNGNNNNGNNNDGNNNGNNNSGNNNGNTKVEDGADAVTEAAPASAPTDPVTPSESAVESGSAANNTAAAPVSLSTGRAADTEIEVRVASCEDPEVRAWHDRMQIFVLFFVDGATYIDSSNPKWLIFASYERPRGSTDERAWTLAAYATAYRFNHDMRFARVRLSQIMTFPDCRGHGHAARLFDAIHGYTVAQGLREVTIEEPSEYLDRLRLALHVRRLRALGILGPRPDGSEPEWGSELAEEIRTRAAIARPIARRCFEIDRLSRVDRTDESDYRRFRVGVKKRMYRMFDADIRRKPAEERKAEAHRLLKDAYEVVEKEYDEVLPKLRAKPAVN